MSNTREIMGFKITREESVATGVRRITAVTGQALEKTLHHRSEHLEQLAAVLNTVPELVIDRVQGLIAENKKLKKQLKQSAQADLKNVSQELLDQAPTIQQAKIIIGQVPFAPVEALRAQLDWLRQKAPTSASMLAAVTEDHKVLLLAGVTDDLVGQGLKAGDIVKHIAPIVGGGGGGRGQFAQAGGKDPSKIEEALAAAEQFIRSKLQ